MLEEMSISSRDFKAWNTIPLKPIKKLFLPATISVNLRWTMFGLNACQIILSLQKNS